MELYEQPIPMTLNMLGDPFESSNVLTESLFGVLNVDI